MDIGKSIGLRYGLATREAFGEALRDLGRENANLVVLDGDVGNSTRSGLFAKEFPERFFNCGIAESNIVGIAAGLGAAGKDVVACSFACFLLCNAFEQIRMSIAFPRLNVKLAGSHGGISVGEDGPSQMAIEDIALAASLPGFAVLVPADEPSARAATRAMFKYSGPVYLRLGRGNAPVVYEDGVDFEIGKAVQLRDGGDITIIACGLMVAAALEAAHGLEKKGIRARVIDAWTVKPLDEDSIIRAAEETGAIVTAEEHLLDGGLGSAVARVVAQAHPVPMGFVGMRNQYAESGAPAALLKKYGLMPDDIARTAEQVLRRK
jgi:transketolase